MHTGRWFCCRGMYAIPPKIPSISLPVGMLSYPFLTRDHIDNESARRSTKKTVFLHSPTAPPPPPRPNPFAGTATIDILAKKVTFRMPCSPRYLKKHCKKLFLSGISLPPGIRPLHWGGLIWPSFLLRWTRRHGWHRGEHIGTRRSRP